MKNEFSSVTRGLFVVALFFVMTFSASAQWATQAIQLRPGWNAVFLELQPEPREIDSVFAGVPVESVWRWNRRFNPVEFIQDPTSLVPAQPDWLVFFPTTHPLASQSTLFSVDGCQAYLIKLPDNAAQTTWTITGRVMTRKIEWLSDSFNFVGQILPANNPPTFQTFFNGSAAHNNQAVYRLTPQGTWQQVPSTTAMQRGEAFWIRCNGQSDFQGPLSVTLPQQSGLDYGRVLVEQTFTIKNSSVFAKTVHLRRLDSANPPSDSTSALAGEVPLNYWKNATATEPPQWVPVPAVISSTLEPGQEWEVRLEVKRTAMTPAAARTADSRQLSAKAAAPAPQIYQSILEVTEAGNSARAAIPVRAEGLQGGGAGAPHARAGLWVGNVEITHVSQPASFNPTNPLPTAAPFQFRLLVHVDENGQARLLQKVLQMWKSGAYRTNESGIREVSRPGQFVLVTDDRLISSFGGSALRDGEPVARRFSSAAFAFKEPIGMIGQGDFGVEGGEFLCSVVLNYDDPLNPFRHTYHPDHDNLDARFTDKQPEGRESFTVTRQVKIRFTDSDPDNVTLAGWGDTQLGGIYSETIAGLHKTPLHLRGTVRLHQASRVPVLNQ